MDPDGVCDQVTGTPALGDGSVGRRGYDRGDLSVEAHKVTNTKTGTETSGLFYPKEGDRVIGFNYVSFRIPPNWLDIDPPTVKPMQLSGRTISPDTIGTVVCCLLLHPESHLSPRNAGDPSHTLNPKP